MTFYAHKYVLGTSSVVFNAMFYDSLAMKDSTVRLSDTNEESLEQFLRFVYTDECTLTSDNVVAIMYLAKKYILPSLNEKCVHFLLKILSVENVLDVLEQADCFDEKELKIGCWKFIVSNIHELVAFSNISQTTLAKLLKRDELNMQEESLEQFLRFVYTDECTMTAENVVAIMCLAKKMLKILNVENVLDVLEQATRSDEKELEKQCWNVIASNTCKVVASDGFNNISQKTLAKLLKQDKLNIREGELLRAVLKWFDFQCSLKNMEPTGENRKSIVGMRWELPKSIKGNIVRFSRFSGKAEDLGDGWKCNGKEDSIDISADKDAVFLGGRLFGDKDGSVYKTERGTFISELNQDGIPGFEVMVKPFILKPNEGIVTGTSVFGPDSCYGKNGVSSVTKQDVTVTFSEPSPKWNRTSPNCGQFHEVIFMI